MAVTRCGRNWRRNRIDTVAATMGNKEGWRFHTKWSWFTTQESRSKEVWRPGSLHTIDLLGLMSLNTKSACCMLELELWSLKGCWKITWAVVQGHTKMSLVWHAEGDTRKYHCATTRDTISSRRFCWDGSGSHTLCSCKWTG